MNRIITIGREFGSGGREIGRRLSEELQIAYYDQEIITKVANCTRLSEEYIQRISERRHFIAFPIHIGHSFYPVTDPMIQNGVLVFAEQHRLLEELSKKSDCIIVGRCADYLLQNKADCLKVFIHADMAFRAKRIVEVYGEREQSPEQRLRDKDKRRAAYHRFYTDMKWGDARNYHIALDSGALGIDKCADMIASLY